MKELFTKIFGNIANIWSKLKIAQRIIFSSVVIAVITTFVLLTAYSGSSGVVSVLTSAITDAAILNKISIRMDQEEISHQITEEGMIYVKDEKTANRVVAILAREDLIPADISPWEVFKMDRWTVTDFERNVNLQRAITSNLQNHLESLEDVDVAKVTLVLPEDTLFAEDQKEVSASIIITPTPGSDIRENRKKIEGIVKLVKFAVEGLTDDFITITDYQGNILNDFTDFADFDRLEVAKREIKMKTDMEVRLKEIILRSLRQVFGQGRVEIINLDIDLDMAKFMVETEEHFPIVMVEDDPKTSYSEQEVVPSITISKNIVDESFRGSGFNPEGPPGTEANTPPAYKDLEGMVGEYKRNNLIQNEVVNTRSISEEKSPWEIKRITVGVVIDGLWKMEYNTKGELTLNQDGSILRNYEPISDEDLAKAKILLEAAVGYDRNRNDSVTVQSIMFDRSEQFQIEDEKHRAKMRMKQIVLYLFIAFIALIAVLIIFRLVIRMMEKRRKLKEDELARQHQAMREATLRSAEEDGLNVDISVEDRARLEMQEAAVNLAREHPDDVAQLIRTWLLEE